MKFTFPASITAIAILVATFVCHLTLGRVISWACHRLLDTAVPLAERENNIALLIGPNTAISLLAGVVSAYVATQFVYAAKSAYIARERIVPYLASVPVAVAAFSFLDHGPYSVPAWEVLRIDIGLFLVHPPVPLVIGLIAGIFIGHRIHSKRI